MTCTICRRFSVDRILVDTESYWISVCKNGKSIMVCLKDHGREPTDEEYKSIHICAENIVTSNLGWKGLAIVYNNDSDHWHFTAKEAWWLK